MSKMAFRNIFRQRRRSVLTALTMFGGFILIALAIGISDGTFNNVINAFTRTRLGHVQIHRRGYLDKPTLHKTIPQSAEITARLSEIPEIIAWAPRLFASGLASCGNKTAGARIVGLDPLLENKATAFEKKIISGKSLSGQPAKHAVIGQGLARTLGAKPGSNLVLVSQGADGSMANERYHIVGLADSGDEAEDRATVYLHLQDGQELLVMEGRIHEICLLADDHNQAMELATLVRTALPQQAIEIAPWQEFAKSFYMSMQADKKGHSIMLYIIFLVVAIGVLNTTLMAVIERTREYGVLKAIGTRPLQIARLVFAEVTYLALGSIAVGAFFALLTNSILARQHFRFSQAMTFGGQTYDTVKMELNLASFYIPALIIFSAAILVTVFPAIKAARTDPAKALRYF